MKRVIRARFKKKTALLDMAPLLDMVFILLIFFVLNAGFSKESFIEVERPLAKSAESAKNFSLVFYIDKEGEVFFEDSVLDLKTLYVKVKDFAIKRPEAMVLLAADKDCPTGFLVQVFDTCRQAGVFNLALAARRPE